MNDKINKAAEKIVEAISSAGVNQLRDQAGHYANTLVQLKKLDAVNNLTDILKEFGAELEKNLPTVLAALQKQIR